MRKWSLTSGGAEEEPFEPHDFVLVDSAADVRDLDFAT